MKLFPAIRQIEMRFVFSVARRFISLVSNGKVFEAFVKKIESIELSELTK